MYGESCAIKRGKTFYYLYLYARDALRAESLEVWSAVLDSANWA